MSIKDILATSGGTVLILMTLVQVSKIEINPWTAIGKVFKSLIRAIGKMFNSALIEQMQEVKEAQQEMREAQQEARNRLDEHIRIDDERNADLHRTYILRFNTELIRKIKHTEEDFNEILYNIRCYESYCKEHEEYENNRAVHAIKNINRVYDECMKDGTFLTP